MVDFSMNDGLIRIEKNSSFSNEIAKELGLNANDCKKMGASLWNQIFDLAEKENMGNIENVNAGQVFQFSKQSWDQIKKLVGDKLQKTFDFVSNCQDEGVDNAASETPPLERPTPFVTPQDSTRVSKNGLLPPHFSETFDAETLGVDTTAIIKNAQANNPKFKSWSDIVATQNEINALQTNKERVIAWNKEFNNNGKNYVIIDKKNFTATVYSSDGKVVKSFEVGVGKMEGDGRLIRNQDGNDLELTTAGIYTVNYKGSGTDSYRDLYDDKILTLSNDALRERGVGNGEIGVALHKIPNGNTRREDLLRREGVSAENNRFSDGCVNFLDEDIASLIENIDGIGTKVYILPEDENNYMCVKNGDLQIAQKSYTGDLPTTRTANDTIQPIKINNEAPLSKQGKKMMQALCDRKAELCKDLGIDNDTYNELALLALGIAGQETNYGDWFAGLSKCTPYFFKEKLPGVFNFFKENIIGSKSFNSRGLTQMKLESYTDPEVKALLQKYEITPDNLAEGENSAIATMIVLNAIRKNELPALKSNIQECNMTTQDALLYCWNNKKKEIKNKTATPDQNIYVQNVNGFMNNFKLYQQMA